MKTDSSETITRIDGKNSYCLIVECATHYPVTAVCKILDIFGAKNATHGTFRTDRVRGLHLSDAFHAMIVKADFTVELTDPDSDLSNQNGIAEQPHRDSVK